MNSQELIVFLQSPGRTPLKRRKTEEDFERNKKLKTENSPVTKKPINLKKTVLPRKRLQPNQNSVIIRPQKYLVLKPRIFYLKTLLKNLSPQILEEDLTASSESVSRRRKTGNSVAYDDVYTRKGWSSVGFKHYMRQRSIKLPSPGPHSIL